MPCCGRACRPTWANRRCRGRTQTASTEKQSGRWESDTSLVWCHLQVIEIHAKLGVGEDAGAALLIRNGIDAVDGPLGRLSIGGRPGFAAYARLAVGRVFDAQFQPVASVR